MSTGVIKRQKITKLDSFDEEKNEEVSKPEVGVGPPTILPRSGPLKSALKKTPSGGSSWVDRKSSIGDLTKLFEDVRKSRESLYLKKVNYKSKESLSTLKDEDSAYYFPMGSPHSPHCYEDRVRSGLHARPPFFRAYGHDFPEEGHPRRHFSRHDCDEGQDLLGGPMSLGSGDERVQRTAAERLYEDALPKRLARDVPSLARAKSMNTLHSPSPSLMRKDVLSKSQWDLTIETSPNLRPTLSRMKAFDESSQEDIAGLYYTVHSSSIQPSPLRNSPAEISRCRRGGRRAKKDNIAFQENTYYTIQGPRDVTSHYQGEEYRSCSPYPSPLSPLRAPPYSPVPHHSSSSSEDMDILESEGAIGGGAHFSYPERLPYPHHYPSHLYPNYTPGFPYSYYVSNVSAIHTPLDMPRGGPFVSLSCLLLR